MKRFLALICAVVIVCTSSGRMVVESNNEISLIYANMRENKMKIGDYFTLGTYKDVPILWRYAADDENGKLIVSDKILCVKPFGIDNIWQTSYIRMWLNSDVNEGEVDWVKESEATSYSSNEFFKERFNANQKNEAGFLSKNNFSDSERSVMKTVDQWTMVSRDFVHLSENGIDTLYNPASHYEWFDISGGDVFYEIEELPDVYLGAAYMTSDTIFLLDEMQVYNMWRNFNNIDATGVADVNYGYYFLRTPYPTSQSSCTAVIRGRYDWLFGLSFGIRPAFYLNEGTAIILSGGGTEDDPYIVDGYDKDNINIYLNNKSLESDTPPVIENGRTLVPFRALFEAFGANVSWDGETGTVTGELGGNTVKLTVDDDNAYINDTKVSLDAAPRIINDRTFVPLRFIAENFGYSVVWDGNMRCVFIDK